MKGFFTQINKGTLASTDADYLNMLGVRMEPQIINTHPADDPLRMRWASKDRVNSELAAVYATLTDVDFDSATDASFAEGGTPNGINYKIANASKLKKHFGVKSGLTNASIAALVGSQNTQGINGKIADAVERTMMILNTSFRNSLDWAMINGDQTTNPLQFDGLDYEITAAKGSEVIALSGTDISRDVIDDIIALQALKGAKVSLIVSNPLMINFILRLYHPAGLSTPIMSQNTQLNPYGFNTIPSVNGNNVELLGDPHVPVVYSSGSDYTTTVYLLTETKDNEDLFYMDYLIPQSMLPDYVFHDGTTATSTTWGMYGVGALISRAPTAQAKITTAGFNANQNLASSIVSLSGTRI